jgi:hypothetical protein
MISQQQNNIHVPEESKTGVRKSLWWPRVTGIVLAVVTLILTGFLPLPIVLVAAAAFFWKGINSVIVVRWWAKIIGTVSLAMLVMIFVGDSMNGVGPPLAAIVAFLPLFITFAGVIIAFRWELIGGVLAAVGALAEQIVVFFVWHGTLNPFIDIFFFVGLGLIYCWWRTRRLSRQLSV